ncbi:MAG: hypothetical protein ACKOAI_06490 [Acidimicrobiia bacterium]
MNLGRKRVPLAVLIIVATIGIGTSVDALANTTIAGTKCAKAGLTRSVKGISYVCVKSGKTLKWVRPASQAAVTKSPTTNPTSTTPTRDCRTTSQITARLPNELQKREWEAVVAKLQPLLATADVSGRTTASIDTFDDPQTGSLNYGRYYPMAYPAAIDETQGGRCAYLALVFGVVVRFTGSDTSDASAKAGIQAAVKSLLQESLAKYTQVDGNDVDVILIEPILDHCPGRAITGLRTQCPWNDVGYLYFRTKALTAAQVSATPASEIFSLSVKGATFPPRPFEQIVGIGPSTQAVVTGTVRNLVPSANKSHQSSTYIEFATGQRELGQSISVDASLSVASITVGTVGHVSIVDGRPASGVGAGVTANIQTRIYKYNGAGDIPLVIRRSDFALQVDVAQAVMFPHYSSVTFDLPNGTVLAPGKYLITFTVSGWNPVGSYIRLESFAQGDAGQTDVYPQGRAYRACTLRERIGYRVTDNPRVASVGEEQVGTNCNLFYPEVSKGENPARPTQHTWVWSDLAMTLNAP